MGFRVWLSGLVGNENLQVEEVAGYPPGEEEDDVGLERCGVKGDALEAVQAVPAVIPRDQHGDERIGNGQDKEVVVAQGLQHVAVDERMQGAL